MYQMFTPHAVDKNQGEIFVCYFGHHMWDDLNMYMYAIGPDLHDT